jgi:hypothetical protein
MTNGCTDIQKTGISSENFSIPATSTPRYYQTRLRFVSSHAGSIGTLCKILTWLGRMDLPGKDPGKPTRLRFPKPPFGKVS